MKIKYSFYALCSVLALNLSSSVDAQSAANINAAYSMHNTQYLTVQSERAYFKYPSGGYSDGYLLNYKSFTAFGLNKNYNDRVIKLSAKSSDATNIARYNIDQVAKKIRGTNKTTQLALRMGYDLKDSGENPSAVVRLNDKIVAILPITNPNLSLYKVSISSRSLKKSGNILTIQAQGSKGGIVPASTVVKPVALDRLVFAIKPGHFTQTIASFEAEPPGPAGGNPSLPVLTKQLEYYQSSDASGDTSVILTPKTGIESVRYNADRLAFLAKNADRPVVLNLRYAVRNIILENPWPVLEVKLNGRKIASGEGRLLDAPLSKIAYQQRFDRNVFFSNAELRISKRLFKATGNVLEIKALPTVKDYGKLQSIKAVYLDKLDFYIEKKTGGIAPLPKPKPVEPPVAKPPLQPGNVIAVTLKGDEYNGPAAYTIKTSNNRIIAQSTVGKTPKTFVYRSSELPKLLSVFFTNDLYRGKGKDRNLRILKVTVNGKPVKLTQNMIDACKWSRVVNKTIVLACGDKRMFDGVFIPLTK